MTNIIKKFKELEKTWTNTLMNSEDRIPEWSSRKHKHIAEQSVKDIQDLKNEFNRGINTEENASWNEDGI